MNILLRSFFLVLMSLFLMAGCASTDQSTGNTNGESQSAQTEEQETTTESAEEEQATNSEQEEVVAVTISENQGEEIIAEAEVPVEEGDTLFDVMEESFTIEHDNGFITSIEGVSQEENERYWMYEVNGEMAEVGAQDYELEPGDTVTFDLQAVE